MLATISLSAQFNVTFVGQLDYSQPVNEIWGYVAPDGREYALLGTEIGFSIVSLEDPSNPKELFFIEGETTVWRDVKTWDNYAYVVCDACAEGMLVVDLSALPDAIDHKFISDFGGLTFNSAHNLYVDEHGYGYLAGTNLGSVVILDCFTDPGQPQFISNTNRPYAHDTYARNNVLFSCESTEGGIGIYDVQDKLDVKLLGSTNTPNFGPHNCWLSDDGNFLFTTDELVGAPIASYDVSDPSDIKLLDLFNSTQGVIRESAPHNVHVHKDYLIISYYTDGCIIVDASNPANLVEVGNFDSYLPPTSDLSGAWGAYPFLPTERILLSDRQNGLFVLQPDYKRASFLKGKITDIDTGESISDAVITLTEVDRQTVSDGFGEYKFGYPEEGSFVVSCKVPFYDDVISNVDLTVGETAELDFKLKKQNPFTYNGKVLNKLNVEPIANAKVRLVNELFDKEIETDANGDFEFTGIYPGQSELFAGKWGYSSGYLKGEFDSNENSNTFRLEEKYEDNFSLDLGWKSDGDFFSGEWEQEDPFSFPVVFVGEFYEVVPSQDSPKDFGNHCYLTENTDPPFIGNVNGIVELESPEINLLNWQSPVLRFEYCFYNSTTDIEIPMTGNSFMEVFISDGNQSLLLETFSMTTLSSAAWLSRSYILKDHIELSDQMKLKIVVTASEGSEITEAGIDHFSIIEEAFVPVSEVGFERINIFPNPANNFITITTPVRTPAKGYKIVDIFGRNWQEGALDSRNQKLTLTGLPKGIYEVIIYDKSSTMTISYSLWV